MRKRTSATVSEPMMKGRSGPGIEWIDDKEQIGTGDLIENEDEIGTVSEWMTATGSGASPNR
jgi:hypothetical protein